MRNRKVIRNTRRQTTIHNTFKLKECHVILYDITLYPELIPPQYRQSFKEQLKQIKISCRSKNHNKQLLEQNILKANVRSSRSAKKHPLKNISVRKSRKKHETIKSRLRSNNIKSTKVLYVDRDDEELQSRFIRPRWQSIIDSDESFSTTSHTSKINDISNSSVLTNTNLQYASKSTVNRKYRPDTNSDILDSAKQDFTYGTSVESAEVGSDDTNYLDKRNLIFIDCNSKTQEVSNEEESIASTEYYNLTRVDFINEVNHEVKQKYSQNKESLSIPSVENEISIKKSFKNTKRDEISKNSYSSDILLSTANNKVNGKEDQHDIRTKLNNNSITPAVDLKSTTIVPETIAINHITEDNLSENSNENKSLTIEQTLPKITRDSFLPKGITIKLVRVQNTETHSNVWKSVSKNNSLERKECDKRNENVEQMMNKDILKKKENHASLTEIKSIDTLKTSKYILTQKNNIPQNSNTLDNDRLHNQVFNRESTSSSTKTKNDIHNDININASSIEAITNTNCTIHHQIDSRKRTAEKNSTDINVCTKKIKLNRNFQQNNVKSYIEPLNQRLNDHLNTITKIEDEECNEIDLRKILDRKKTEKISKLKTIDNDKTIDNTKSMEVNNKNSINGVTNMVENEETYEKFSQKEASTLNIDVQNNAQISSFDNSDSYLSDNFCGATEKTHYSQTNINACKDTNVQRKDIDDVSNNCDDEEDDDCISLFANETFDISYCEDMFPDKQEKLSKSLQSDTPYVMSTSSFNKYLKQNTSEFNKEYERCMKNNMKKPQIKQNSTGNKFEKMKVMENSLPKTCKNELLTMKETLPKITQNVLLPKGTVLNKQLEQTSHTDNLSISSTNLKFSVQKTQILSHYHNIQKLFNGFCFNILSHSTCKSRSSCTFRHDFQDFIKKFTFQDPNQIMDLINYAKLRKFYFFCRELYRISLRKLNIDQILTGYTMFYDIWNLSKNITSDVIKELLSRQISLKNVVDYIVASINSSVITDVTTIYEIFQYIKQFMKPGEYWYIAKNMVSILTPNKYIVEDILYDYIRHGKLSDVQDINDILINKLHPDIMSQLNKHLMIRFKSLLTEKAAKDTYTVESVYNFGENSNEMDTIASPDSKQMESPKSYNNIVINRSQTNKIERYGANVNVIDRSYILHPIDNLPKPRSVYRNHEHLWKFYVDLERIKKGLEHQDYDYVINILEEYTEKQDDNLFVRSCCNMFRTEIKRTDHHLINIIQRTVQTGTFAALRRILFDIGIDILVALMDEEAWKLAFHLIKSLKTCDLPSSAEFTMLSAEIYLANKKTLEALNLFKNKNIICTSRAKWRVVSTVHDEYVRNKLIYILLDSLCNGLIEHAFFLFTFLLRDQSSQFYPIDLSRYVDKLITLLLSKNETALIMEMGNLILKYNFPLNTKTCRALIATLIHIDEKLAIQLYYYAEAIGFYSTVELWPITHVIINNDLTEEEIYLIILQLLEKLKINFGHTIECITSQQFAVYVVLEVKSTEQFYSAEQQTLYNNRAITNIKALIRNVLKKRFDPPIILKARAKEKICRLQNKSLINYLKSEHCN